MSKDLTVAEVAQIAECHRNTVLRYEDKGLIKSERDFNGFRRFSLGEALKLKTILSVRNDNPAFGGGLT
jgi:DNA-binding transcriptional MerR regulator